MLYKDILTMGKGVYVCDTRVLNIWEQGCKYRLECEAGWSLRLLSGDLFLYLFCIFLLASRLPTPPVPERGLSSV